MNGYIDMYVFKSMCINVCIYACKFICIYVNMCTYV